MKTSRLILKFLCFGLFLFLSANLRAQDPLKVAPEIVKKVYIDNDQVRVMEIEFPVGYTEPWHSHPNYVGYPLTDGTLEITEKGKDPVVVQIKANNVMYGSAVTHMAKNIGSAPLRLILTEIKPAKTDDINAALSPAENPKK